MPNPSLIAAEMEEEELNRLTGEKTVTLADLSPSGIASVMGVLKSDVLAAKQEVVDLDERLQAILDAHGVSWPDGAVHDEHWHRFHAGLEAGKEMFRTELERIIREHADADDKSALLDEIDLLATPEEESDDAP
jgi:hypothetical protein